VKLGALVLAVSLLALTFLHPSARLTRESYRILLILDITQSMNTPDYVIEEKRISRLEFAKRAAHHTLLALPCGSEIGVGVFTEYRSFLLLAPVEVCANYQELTETLRGIDGRIAWAGASEVAKGLNSAKKLAQSLEPASTLLFVSDGHEAPPLHPQHHPKMDDVHIRGVVAGAGASELSPIPKFGPDGEPLGFWRADDVLQTDTYSMGRGRSGEHMVDEKGNPVPAQRPTGTEHLSSLKEAHLKQIATEAGMTYQRLDQLATLATAMSSLAVRTPIETDLRWALAALALVFVLAYYAPIDVPIAKTPRRT
jgi:mxaL protein